MVRKQFLPDVEHILARRYDNGGDYWDSGDGRIGVGGIFSTLEALIVLHELRVPRTHEAVKGALGLLFDAITEDGRCRVTTGAIYPCHTAWVARVLARFGYAKDRRVSRVFDHLLETQHEDGGWRCKKVKLGRSPVTDASNPGVTLHVLDAFRFVPGAESDPALERAAESLLEHWEVRRPMGPCGFGIGSRFLKVEYPFRRYNLFYYVYVLSHFAYARGDGRFLEALELLRSKTDERDRLVVQSPHQKLSKLVFCRKGEPSELATGRYREILSRTEPGRSGSS